MALIGGGYEDSGGNESYPRIRSARSGVGTTAAMPMSQARTEFPRDPNNPNGPLTPQPTTTTTTAPPPAPAPNYQTLGQYANRLGGYDMGKFQQPYDQWSEKYKIGAVQSWFDPLQGVTPDFLKALNSLGLAGFSGGGDQLSVNNTNKDPRFGQGGTADVVHGLKGQNQDTGWMPWFVDEGQGQQGPLAIASPGVPGFSGGFYDEHGQPSINITNSGLDPAVLQAILAMIQPPQTQQVQAPAYQPSAPVTQATPMPMFTGSPGFSGALQTQAVAPQAAPGMDPFMAWLRNQVLGGAQ